MSVTISGKTVINNLGIVTDGLIVYYDPGNTDSYPGSGSNLSDLIGDSDSTLYGVSFLTNPSRLYFNSDYAESDSLPSDLHGDPDFTVCGWFQKSGVDWIQGATWGLGGSSVLNNINSYNHDDTNDIAIDLWGNTTFVTGEQYTDDFKFISWCKTSGAFDTSNISIYVNTTEFTGNDLTASRSGGTSVNISSSGKITLGRAGTTNNYYSNVNMGPFMVYNRVLSAPEIQQNYNALRDRFD